MKHIINHTKKITAFVFGAMIFLSGCSESELDKDWDVKLFEPGTIDATASSTSISYGESITFTDMSTKVYDRSWTFETGDPATSTDSVVSVTFPIGGSHKAILSVTHIDNTIQTKEFTIEVEGPAISQWPFGDEPIAIPGVIEAEDYDNGGEGFAYHDTEAENQAGGDYRPDDGIDIEVGDTRTNIGYSNEGEWIEYTVNVANAGVYDFDFTVASGSSDGGSSLKIQLVGEDDTITDLGETGDFENTGGWGEYTSLVVEGIELESGEQVLRLYYTGGGVNLDKVEVTAQSIIEKYGIYTEGSTIGSVGPVVPELNNGFTYEFTDDAAEGSEAVAFIFDGVDTWGVMAAMRQSDDDGATFNNVDISAYADGFYNISLKTTCTKAMNLRLQGGGVNGYVTLDDAVKKYGFERDGNWHSLKIPVSDFADGGETPDLADISHLLVLRSNAGDVLAGDDWDWYVDDIYLTME
ncbi:carbohydrate-binding protein [Marinilabilia salmonicolor]|uniref:carbohydrate-binding protein n=1 Tax=Marinilabilia salmonicolor TaxID=989 RepID=UPI00029A3BAA|nr:carbohydrate-binding protein [Marinilabilia salmonicolor]